MNRPERRNAIDPATAAVLADAVRAADADPEVSVLVLAGAGDHFCAGADLKALAGGGTARPWTPRPTARWGPPVSRSTSRP